MNNSILILGAMDCETDLLIEALEDAKKTVVANYEFYEGIFCGKKIIVAKTFVGMENAAATTALALLKFNVDFVITQGTAGGHNPDLHQNDIVIGKKLLNLSAIKSRRRKLNEGIDLNGWELFPVEIFDGKKMSEATELFSDKNLVDAALKIKNDDGKVVEGIIGSSNNWNCELDRINLLHKKFGTDCEEMESFAAAQICAQFQKPCIAIRIISNSEQHPEETYRPEIGINCQKFVLKFIKNLSAAF